MLGTAPATDGMPETLGSGAPHAAEDVAAGRDVVAGIDAGAAAAGEGVVLDATPGSAGDIATGEEVVAREPSGALGGGITRGAAVGETYVSAGAVTAPVGPSVPTAEAAGGEAGSAPAAVLGPDATAVCDGSPGGGTDVVSGSNVDRCPAPADFDVGVAVAGTATVVGAAVWAARVLASPPPP